MILDGLAEAIAVAAAIGQEDLAAGLETISAFLKKMSEQVRVPVGAHQSPLAQREGAFRIAGGTFLVNRADRVYRAATQVGRWTQCRRALNSSRVKLSSVPHGLV